MKVRAWLAFAFWLLVLALLSVSLVLGWRNGLANITDAISLVALLAFGTVGPIIVARRPGHLIGWLFCVDVLLNALAGAAHEAVQYTLVTQPGALPGPAWLAWIVSWIGDSGWALLFTFTFLLFPTGRLPSPRWRPLAWLIAALLVFHTFVAMFSPGPFNEWPTLTNPVGRSLAPALLVLDAALDEVVVFLVIASIASLVLRFRAIRGEERQQIKWVGYVTTLLLAIIIPTFLLDLGEQSTPLSLAFEFLAMLGLTAFPIAVGLSVLRYRLWDIDVIIRRTLIYAVLTAALALLYVGSTVVLQQVFRTLTHQESQLVIVVSTLAIAAVFAPLRRSIQRAIDRRFYRGTLNAAQTLAAFSTTARNEVDLDRLTQALLDSVGGTFEPAHVSLWLPPKTPPAASGPR